MIHEMIVTKYQCKCDNCNEVIEFGDGWRWFEQMEDLDSWIENDEALKTIDGKHICDNCFCKIEGI